MTKDFPGIWKWILPALIALLSMPTACQASLKMKDAQVESRGGVPCFSPAEVPGGYALLQNAIRSFPQDPGDSGNLPVTTR